ncbi:MAG: DNA-binding response regulator [Magnetococcales bacterium]|nr:DNA-binding response regulator [Magnetococcales bacterium]
MKQQTEATIMNKGRILSVDDDQNLQMVVSQYLESEGYSIDCAYTVASALEKSEGTDAYNIVLLDLCLTDGEGLSLITQLRSKTNASIIVISGKSDTTEKVVCLEMGADDYITKPFELRELSARLKAVLRRVEAPAPAAESTELHTKHGELSGRLQLENWIMDCDQYAVTMTDGSPIDLTTGEFKLLQALVKAANRALSREQLFDLTRDGNYDAFDRAIDIQVARIRKKLGDDDNSIIKTIRGVGYMYSGKVEQQTA